MITLKVKSFFSRGARILLPNYLIQQILRLKYSSYLSAFRCTQLSLGCQFEGKNLIGKSSEFSRSRLGYASYVGNNSIIRCAHVGAFTCIGDFVRTGLGRHPVNEFVSVHPAFFSKSNWIGFSFTKEQLFDEHLYVDAKKKYYVEIGSDVWIGNNVIIMDGLTIGNGAIVAAGAVVTKSVEPYSVVGGVPAKLIKKRFPEDDVNFLLQSKWWEKNIDWLKSNASSFSCVSELRKVLGKDIR